MFGFLNPKTRDLSYRSLYSRGCQHLKLSHGVKSLLFHSFESVFLYSFAADVGAFDRKKIPAKRCCKLQASRTLLNEPDRVYGEFSSNFSMLLTSIKLEDDILDNNSLLARTAKYQLRKPIKKAQHYFSSMDAHFKERTSGFIQEHHDLERSSRLISVEELTRPTAEGFGYMFQMYSQLPHMQQHRDSLKKLGNHIGSAIIAYDCGVDWKRDLKRGDFNPVKSEAEAIDSLRRSVKELRAAARYVKPITDEDGTTPPILDSVADDIEQKTGDKPEEPFQPRQRGCGHNVGDSGVQSCCPCGSTTGDCFVTACFELTCGGCCDTCC